MMATEPGAAPLRVLVVDDTSTNRQILQVFLKKLGYAVVLAENGFEALEKFPAEQPDIVLMDVMMPLMDGFEATRRIKELAVDRWVPVVYLTALDKETDLVTGLDSGGDDYMTKPVSFTVLDAKLRSLRRTLGLQRNLEEARRRTRAITDNLADGVINLDETGRIQFCNPAVARIFRYARDEMTGRHVGMLMQDAEGGDPDRVIDAFLSGEPPRMVGRTRQLRGRRKDGAEVPLEVTVSEFSIGRERYFVGIVRDISERLAAEARLRDNAERLQRYHDAQEDENVLAHSIIRRLTDRDAIGDPQLRHWLRPAANFSGDVIAAARSPEGRLYALFGDAMGHGLAAAISAVPAITVFYGMARRNLPLRLVVAELNRHLCDALPPGRFFAVSLFCADSAGGNAEIWIGGMPEVLQLDGGGRIVGHFASTQMPLGVIDFDEPMCETEIVTGVGGSEFVFFSDGLADAADESGDAFGVDRLAATLAAAPPARRVEAVRAALMAHIGAAEPRDDISIMTFSC